MQRRDVATRLGEITANHGQTAAARARLALSGLFTWAMREGMIEANLAAGTNKPAEPPSRDRVLSDVELAEIWAACRDDDYGRIVKLLLLSGQRRDENRRSCLERNRLRPRRDQSAAGADQEQPAACRAARPYRGRHPEISAAADSAGGHRRSRFRGGQGRLFRLVKGEGRRRSIAASMKRA